MNNPMYSVFKTHSRVEEFLFNLKSSAEVNQHPILISLWKFYNERGFLTVKQVCLARKILEKHSMWGKR